MMIKKAILKAGLLFVLAGIPYLGVKTYYVKNYDVNYYKATQKANHLILGLSRAKRGLSPAIFEKELGLEGRMLNFAFNNLESPYGPDYYKVIKKKVIKTEKNGLFLISVTPGSIMELIEENTAWTFREEQFFYYDLWFKNGQPNWEYIIRSPVKEGSLFQFMRNRINACIRKQKINSPEIVHADGWGELDERYKPSRSRPIILNRTFHRSPVREKYLEKTIAFLQNHGTVVLIRLPMGKTYQQYEQELYPVFPSIIEEIAKRHQVTYLDYFDLWPDQKFHDGHHLFGDEARKISYRIARDIKSSRIVESSNR